MDTFLLELAKSGPWAVVAGFLLWTILKAWTDDRKQVTELLGEFRATLDKLSDKLDRLAEAINREADVETRALTHR